MKRYEVLIVGILWAAVGSVSTARGEVVTPLATYSNPTPLSGEKFGRYVHSNGTDAFVSDSDAAENGLGGAVYRFDLLGGTLARTYGSPEGANEVNFGDKDAIATLGGQLLIGDWGARRQCFNSGVFCFGGLGYRFDIATGDHLETYTPVGRPNLGAGAYALGIVAAGNRVVVGWTQRKALDVFDAGGGFLFRREYLSTISSGFGSPIKALGSKVVVGTGGSASATRAVHIIDLDTGAIVAAMSDPRPTGLTISSIFGEAIAVNAAGTRILVGAYRGNTAPGTGEGPGVAYLYDSNGTLLRAIDAPPGVGGFFGWDVEFLGENLLISATNNPSGVVVLFDGTTGEILRRYDGYASGQQFGYSLGAVDGTKFLVGALGTAYLLPGPDPVSSSPPSVPAEVAIDAAPNPARDRTTFRYTLPAPDRVDLSVFDVAGRRVANPIAGTMQASGLHEVDVATAGWAPGCYFYRLEAGGRVVNRKLMVTR